MTLSIKMQCTESLTILAFSNGKSIAFTRLAPWQSVQQLFLKRKVLLNKIFKP